MWTFPTTEVQSGDIVDVDLPFTSVSFTDQLMGSGAFTGTLPINHPVLPTNLREVGTRWQTWPCRDGVPFGAYTWKSGSQQSLSSPVFQLTAERSDVFLFGRRPVLVDLVYTNKDAYDVLRDLFRAGQAQTTLYTDSITGPHFWQGYGVFPWLRMRAGQFGTTVTKTKIVNGQEDDGYRRKRQTPIIDAVRKLADELNFEVHPRYGVDPSTQELFMRIDMAAPLGNPAGSADAIVLEYPGDAVQSGSYGWDATDFRTAAAVVGGEAQGDSAIGYNEPITLLQAGYPYMRTAKFLSSVTNQTQLTAAAAAEYRQVSQIKESFNVTLNGSAQPGLGSYAIGDCVTLRVDHGAGLVDRVLRITGWSIKVDDTRVMETVTPTLSEVPL